METTIRQYTEKDLAAVTKIWNEVVAEGNAFPQDTPFTPASRLLERGATEDPGSPPLPPGYGFPWYCALAAASSRQ